MKRTATASDVSTSVSMIAEAPAICGTTRHQTAAQATSKRDFSTTSTTSGKDGADIIELTRIDSSPLRFKFSSFIGDSLNKYQGNLRVAAPNVMAG
jgi:hypothetical protein